MSSQERVLVVFVDALGPDPLDRFDLSFLPHRRALRDTSGDAHGALPTLLTGTIPVRHERIGPPSTRRAPESPPRSRFLHERGPVRRLAARLLAELGGLTGHVALHHGPPGDGAPLDLPEGADLFQTDEVGGQRTFLADARRAGLMVFSSPWQMPERERWELSRCALSADPPDLAFLYAAELDDVVRRDSSDSPAASACRSRLAGSIERARELMAQGGDVTTLVVGVAGTDGACNDGEGPSCAAALASDRPLPAGLRGLHEVAGLVRERLGLAA